MAGDPALFGESDSARTGQDCYKGMYDDVGYDNVDNGALTASNEAYQQTSDVVQGGTNNTATVPETE